MRTVTFQHVLWGAARLLGMNPSKDLNAANAARLTAYIQLRYEEGLRKEFWSELCPVEERTPNVTTKVIALAETGFTTIGRVKSVSQLNPETNRRANAIAFQQTTSGIQLPNNAPTTVFVKFRVRPVQWTSEPWAAGTYAAGLTVYHASSGECYLSLANTAAVPGTDAAAWQKLDFPEVLSPFVIRAAGADALGDQKQNSRKMAELSTAYADLEDAVVEDQEQQGEYQQITVDGYGSRRC